MIVDSLANASLYHTIHGRLAQAFDFLRRTNLETLPSGKVGIDGASLFALVNDYTPAPKSQCKFESHRKYTDLQYMVRGREQIGVANPSQLQPATPYDDDRDILFYEGQGDVITLSPGVFALFFPHDAHQPGIEIDPGLSVRKIVFKIDWNDL